MCDEVKVERIKRAVEDFVGLLHDYRLRNHLSLDEMSDILGCSSTYLWRMEKRRRLPNLDARLRMLHTIWSKEEVQGYLQEMLTRNSSES